MRTIKLLVVLSALSISSLCHVEAQQLKVAKLRNGLTVYAWEDKSKPDITGVTVARVGSVDDPEDLTGMAHYLEHLMFKGTEVISALDWEKERPIYEQIIAKYDEMAAETNSDKRKAISAEINKLTLEAAQYSNGDEFTKLIEQIGGQGLNAGTSYDFTMYYNSFPSNHLEKWLELYSERMINPVFRTFQPELETVYEEYNRAQDNPGRRLMQFVSENLYNGHPYSRAVIGLGSHLKNPQLSRLIDFYNTWYIPENMALILVGNVDFDQALPLIKEKFAKMPKRPLPIRQSHVTKEIKGRKEVSAKLMPYPMLVMGFEGVIAGHTDELTLQIACRLLSNSSQTGMLDRLMLDGEVNGISCNSDSRKESGRILFTAIPYYDQSQRSWSSHASVEKMIQKEIDNLKNGNFEDWVLESIKGEMIRSYNISMESNQGKMNQLLEVFVYDKQIGEILEYPDRVKRVTREQILEVAKRYFNSDLVVMKISTGNPAPGEKLNKPDFKAVEVATSQKSPYAEWLEGIQESDPIIAYCDFNSVNTAAINDQSKLFYTKNTENDIYTLTLKYGVGTLKIPDLNNAVSLMANAGIMGQMKPLEFKQEMSKLNARCSFRVTDDYLYIALSGSESNLQEACLLLTRQILMPALDEKQVAKLVGSVYQERAIAEKDIESQSDALIEYILYGDKSRFIDRTPIRKISELTVSDYTGLFQKATNYAAEIHYVGTLPFEDVKEILASSLPLKQGEIASASPEIRQREKAQQNTVYFVANPDAKQSKIYFLVEGADFNKENDIPIRAFNSYFQRLVYDEIREKRSMAYEARGFLIRPKLPENPTIMQGFVGTQGDKTVEAVEVFTALLANLPVQPERMNSVKMNLKESLLTEKPLFRTASQVYEEWKRMGYNQDPAQENHQKIENLSFDDVQKVYDQNIKGKPYAIAIVGNPKDVDLKALEAYGKVVRLNTNKIFSERKN